MNRHKDSPGFARGSPRCVPAFQNQVAPAPGQHVVPFESPARPKPATPRPPSYAPANVPPDTIISYLRTHKLCFKSAFLGKRDRTTWRYRHDTVPDGFYGEVSRDKRGAPPRLVVALLSESVYEFAMEL